MTIKRAWHFIPANRKLRYGDGRIVTPGNVYYDDNRSNGKLCESGLLHWSPKVIDAFNYAPGPVLCEVEPGGEIFYTAGDEKGGSTERYVIRMADVTNVLHEAECQFAEQALQLIEKPDPRSLAAIQAKRDLIAGKIADKELHAARVAAWAAAEPAVWDDAAWAAIRTAQNDILMNLLKNVEWEE